MTPAAPRASHPDRRSFLKTTGAVAAGTMLYPYLGCTPREGAFGESAAAVDWLVRPFPLSRVSLGDGIFSEKRDRMLHYARTYGGEEDVHGGPDRLLSIFRANAGLDTLAADAVGGWETRTGFLRGHYAGHFMSMLAQAWAGTGDPIYKTKLDYMVAGLAECQTALAEAAAAPTVRVPGRHGGAVRLSGSPLGHAEHVQLPAGILDDVEDFTIALWINPALYVAADLPDRRGGPLDIVTGSVVFDFGSPAQEYGAPPTSRMYLTLRASEERPVPRFAITTSGTEGEQSLHGRSPLPFNDWTHLAVTRAGGQATLYVNGEAVDVLERMTLSPADLAPMTALWLGRQQFPQRNLSYLNALLDEVQILGRGLDAAGVRALMTSPDAAGGDTLAWYRFDEDGGPTALDSSGQGHDAMILAPTDGRRHPGFLSAYPETQFVRLEEFATYGGSQGIWAPYYTLHKIMAGLIDAHLLADNTQALDVLTGIGDWATRRLLPLRQEQLDGMWDIYIAGEYGGVNESLATLHGLVPDRPEYLEAAKRFVNNNVFAPTLAGEDRLEGRHANQHIPQFTGYLRTYEGNGDEDFLTAARNFWDMVVPHRTYAHGGVGVGEMLRTRDVVAGSLFEERNHAETCPLYNMLKLGRDLFFHQPDPKYMDFYELGLFNQMVGSRGDRDSDTSPEVTYFVPVRPGERRRYGNTGTCCGGTGMESHTKYQDSIYFRSADDDALYVNLYIPSTLRWPERGFTITQETRFPFEGAGTLFVEGEGRLELKLRVPAWVRRGFTVSVNGAPVSLEAVPGSYVSLSRAWTSGDRVDVTMPLSLRTEPTLDDPTVQALYFGPILLPAAAEPVGESLEDGLIPVSLYRWMKRDGGVATAFTPSERPLHFTAQDITFGPLFVADERPYHMYFRRHEPDVVFGSEAPGVPNSVGADGQTFLDRLWAVAPFPDHQAFMEELRNVADAWVAEGALSAGQRDAVIEAGRRAEADLEP